MSPFNRRLRIKSDKFAALSVALVPVLYFLPAILKGKVLCPDDGIIFNTPLRVAAAQIVRSGNLPLWNPYLFSGMPLLAAAQGGLLFPPNWFYLLFAPAVATNLMVVSTYVIAALGAYLYARRVGASVAGAMITSLVWQMSGCLVGQISHINIVQTAAMLPWVLWALESFVGGHGFRRGALLAGLVALQVFAGHQQAFVYSLMLVAAYAIVMAVADPQLRKRYLSSLAFVASGVLLSAVQIVPTFELLRNSPRADATYDFFTSFSMPRRFVLAFFAPYLMGGGDGRLFRAPYVGPPFYPEMVGYAGLLAIMLALVALLIKPDARTKFWGVAAVVCMLLAFGGYAPLQFYRLIYYVPVLNLFRVPARHIIEVNFAIAVMAGRGLTILGAERGKHRVLGRVVLAGALVFLITCLAVTYFRPADFHLAREAAVSVIHAPELFIPVLIAAISAWALWLFTRRRRGSGALLFAILFFDLVLWGHSSGWYTASPMNGGDYWGVPETVQILRSVAPQGAGSYRILTASHRFDPAIAPIAPSVSHSPDWVLWTQPDIYMMHGIQNAAGYDGFGVARYNRLAGQMKVWGELENPDLTLRGASREIDLLNVRYLLSMRAQSGAKDAAPTSALEAAFPTATKNYGGFMFGDSDLDLTNINASRRLRFVVTPVEADQVALVTTLSWSEDLPDGTVVARLRLEATDGRTFEFPLQAGLDTADWAYDRPDIRSRIRHKRPTVATSYQVSDARYKYEGHTYVSAFALPERVAISGGEITVEAQTHAPDLLLNVQRLSLINTRDSKTYPLPREWVSVEDTSTRSQEEAQEGAQSAAPDQEVTSNRWRLIRRTRNVDIYQNLRSLPRAWVAADSRVLDDDAMLQVIRTGRLPDGSRWDPLQVVLVEAGPSNSADSSAGASSKGSVEVSGYEANRVDLKTVSAEPSILVLSENYYSGWRAYLDDQATDALRVDYNLRGVRVPGGQHRVSFVYRPNSLLIGGVVSALTLIALFVISLSAKAQLLAGSASSPALSAKRELVPRSRPVK